MSSEKYFIDTKYGFEIYSKATRKINNNTIGLVYNSDFNIILIKVSQIIKMFKIWFYNI